MHDRTLLVVDDDPEILAFYRRLFSSGDESELDILSPEGTTTRETEFVCSLFTDARELLRWYARERERGYACPLCILDVRMPGLSGVEAARELRRLDPEIGIVLCSAYSDLTIPEIRRQLRSDFHYVRKPVAPEEFYLLVQSLVESWRRLRKSEEERAGHMAVLQTLAEGVIVIAPDGRVEAANPAAARLLGLDEDALIGRTWPPETCDLRDEDGSPLEAPGAPGGCERLNARLEGTPPRWLQLSCGTLPVRPEATTKTTRKVVAIQDHTDETELLQDVLREKARYADLLEATRAGCWHWDLATGVVLLDPRWAEIGGYALSDLAPADQTSWRELRHPDDLLRTDDAHDRHLRGETPHYDCEYRIRHKDGSWVWVHDRGMVVARTRDGKPLRMAGTCTDITERKRLEETRVQLLTVQREAKEKAEEIAAVRARFLATLSHEIRTPLGGMLGLAELLAAGPLEASQRELVDLLRESGDQLLHLLNDVLDHSRLQAGALVLESIAFDPASIVEDVLEAQSARILEKGLAIACDCPPDLPRALRGDPNRIRQILVNLLGNAIKFTDRGGIDIAIATTPSVGGSVRLSVQVRDTGPGLEPERREILFQAFTQADASIARTHGGTGLGLSICRELAERMGGRMTLASLPGRGSTFGFEIPLETASPAELDAPLDDHIPPGLRVALTWPEDSLHRNLALWIQASGGCLVGPEDAQVAIGFPGTIPDSFSGTPILFRLPGSPPAPPGHLTLRLPLRRAALFTRLREAAET